MAERPESDLLRLDWDTVARSLARPYRVRVPMVFFVSLIPLYILIPAFFPPATRHLPELALDRALPLIPLWALVYGALYLFLILLPVFVVRQDDLIRRTVYAYLLVWIAAYLVFFVFYPTLAPRPARVIGDGFVLWGLRTLYAADPPYNCFPSLHVAHSFVSALAARRVHRGVGTIAAICAALVAVSTLLTTQHYVVDVIAGGLLAVVAWAVFLRGSVRADVPELDRRAAPALALCVSGVVAAGLAIYWLVYLLNGETHFDFGP